MNEAPPPTKCPSCAQEVPGGSFCVRCGASLSGPGGHAHRRRQYAAAPHEHRHVPSIVSSLFPHLPRADMRAFRVSLALGVAVVVALALASWFTLAVAAGAVLVPMLTVLYLQTVEIYEGEPPLVLGVTAVWGLLVGVGIGLLTRSVTSTGPTALTATRTHDVLLQGILLPMALGGLAQLGPLVLLRHRKFNDVLDGVTFGATVGAAAVGAQTFTLIAPSLTQGLHVPGRVAPLTARAIDLALLQPVLGMATIALASGALWLRFHHPAVDRGALGPLGHPLTAIPIAAGLLILGAVGEPLRLSAGEWLASLVVLDAIALWCLRQVIHVGLLEEAAAIPIGPEFQCANCGEMTPRHSFCASCGVSLRALPKPTAGGAQQRPVGGELPDSA